MNDYLPCSLGTRTFASAAVDADAILVSGTPGTTSAGVTFSGVGLDGAIGDDAISPTRLVTIATSSETGAYTITAPVVITGTNDVGAVITDSVYLTDVDGGETVETTKAFASVTSVFVPQMALNTGRFTVGVGDIAIANGFKGFRTGGTGNVSYKGLDGKTDTVLACLAGDLLPFGGTRIVAATTTATNITLVIF